MISGLIAVNPQVHLGPSDRNWAFKSVGGAIKKHALLDSLCHCLIVRLLVVRSTDPLVKISKLLSLAPVYIAPLHISALPNVTTVSVLSATQTLCLRRHGKWVLQK